jgi:cytochrome c oxidase assembly factor CtaG
METGVAAARWAETWQRAWPAGDAAVIERLYAPHASYRSSALADPEPGGVTAYLAVTASRCCCIAARFMMWAASGQARSSSSHPEYGPSCSAAGCPATAQPRP